eukprot:753399-Hanusia_phi.AAC.6
MEISPPLSQVLIGTATTEYGPMPRPGSQVEDFKGLSHRSRCHVSRPAPRPRPPLISVPDGQSQCPGRAGLAEHRHIETKPQCPDPIAAEH